MRYLEPHEIEIRIGSTSKDKTKAMLLLYKNARVDMDILDETYGSENWQSNYERIGDVLYCSIGVYNKESATWVWKQSNGIESQGTGETDPNNSKGEASDAFKRSGFMWGIGRELYKWKKLWVTWNGNKYEEYSVEKIEYTEQGEPKSLIIKDSKGNIVYKLENGYYKKVSDKDNTKQAPQEKIEPQAKNEPLNENVDDDERIVKEIENDIKIKNREIWNNLVFEGVKVLERVTEYEKSDLSKISNDYLKTFIKTIASKPLTKIEFTKTQKAPEIVGWETVLVNSELEIKFERYIENKENGGELF